MSENRMVKIMSTVGRTVIVNRPEYGIRRQWVAKGQTQMLPFEAVQNLLFTVGFANLINQGVLYIPDMQDKIDLGLEDPGTTEPTRIMVMDEKNMNELMKMPFDDFVKKLARYPLSQAHELVTYAVNNQIVDNEKTDYLRELTGKDIMKIIARRKEEAIIDRREADLERQRNLENQGRKF